MKAFLLYRDRDFDVQQQLPFNEGDLSQDLELGTLFQAMAGEDRFLFDVAKKALFLAFSSDPDTIRYRQDILKDCLNNPSVARELYDLAVQSIENEKKVYFGIFRDHPSTILHRSLDVMQMFVGALKRLRAIAVEQEAKFGSEGMTRLFAMLRRELNERYFAEIQDHLRRLKFREGLLISAELDKGNKGTNYILRKPPQKEQRWLKRIFARKKPFYTLFISERDESGSKALSEIKDKGINLAANALAQSNDHIVSFFSMLRVELAFYIGCLNLHERLKQRGGPICFPAALAPGAGGIAFKGLYDACLALSVDHGVVGNDMNADHKDLVVITGANQGGKSTFLRSIGLAQLLMQCGMFVPAEYYRAGVCGGLFTHFKREEDAAMNSGKLEEELKRMSEIVDRLKADSLLLLNESFAATNEREGSEIAHQIISALLEKRVKIFYVTHLYEFAHGFYEGQKEQAVFLRAERQANGERTFKILEGPPLDTSFGEDLYRRIFPNGGSAFP